MEATADLMTRSTSGGDAAWTIDATHEIYSNGFFRLRRDECRLRRQPSVRTDWFVLELPDCVSVVPITADGRIVLIEQYRHGVGEWMLECPGGSVEDDDTDPGHAAGRELIEETGFSAGEIVLLGSHPRDPGSQSTQVHTYLARDCQVAGDAQPGAFEDMRLRLVDRDELTDLVRGGANFDASTLASLLLALTATAFMPE